MTERDIELVEDLLDHITEAANWNPSDERLKERMKKIQKKLDKCKEPIEGVKSVDSYDWGKEVPWKEIVGVKPDNKELENRAKTLLSWYVNQEYKRRETIGLNDAKILVEWAYAHSMLAATLVQVDGEEKFKIHLGLTYRKLEMLMEESGEECGRQLRATLIHPVLKIKQKILCYEA